MAAHSMERWFELILLTILILLVHVLSAMVQVKPVSNDTLTFVPDNPGQVYVRTGEFVELDCYASGYQYLIWKKLDDEKGFMEFPWYRESSRLRLRDSNQTLEITKAIEHIDNGSYRCEAGNALGQVIQHDVVITIVSCHVTDGKIYRINAPPSKVIKAVGETVRLNCEGYFGCTSKGSEGERIAQWVFVKSGGHPKTVRNSSRFTIESETSVDSVTVGSLLTIDPIDDEDYDTTFICLLQTIQVYSAVKFNVTIQPPEVEHSLLLYFLFFLAIIPVILLMGFIYCFWGQRIKYFYKFRCLKFKYDEDYVVSDVTVLHSEADKTFVEQHVTPQIEAQGYRVFTRNSILLGRFEVNEFTEAALNSSIIFVVYSSNLLDDKEAVYIFKTMKEAAHAGMVLIQKEKIPKEKLKQFKDDEILKEATKYMKTEKWPFSDQNNQRKVKNFYYGLKCLLPPKQSVADSSEINRSSVSSTTPLVQQNHEDFYGNTINYDLQNVSEGMSIIERDNLPGPKHHTHTQISYDSGKGDSPNEDEMPFFDKSVNNG